MLKNRFISNYFMLVAFSPPVKFSKIVFCCEISYKVWSCTTKAISVSNCKSFKSDYSTANWEADSEEICEVYSTEILLNIAKIREANVTEIGQLFPNDNLTYSLLHSHMFHKTPNKVYIFWKLNNCRFWLLLDIRQEIKPFPKIAITCQKHVVSQIEFVSGQNLTGESERHRFVFFTPWSKKRCQGILITCLVCF